MKLFLLCIFNIIIYSIIYLQKFRDRDQTTQVIMFFALLCILIIIIYIIIYLKKIRDRDQHP